MFKKFVAMVLMVSASLAMAAVDVNKASEAELDAIKGIGPSTTQAILAERKKATFKDWDDLISRVKGIGPARATKLSTEGLTVGGATYKVDAAAEKSAAADKLAAAKEKGAAAKSSAAAAGTAVK